MSRTERRRSIRLRLALATAALIATVTALVLAGLWTVTTALVARDAEEEALRELEELLGHHRDLGFSALADEVTRRAGHMAYDDSVYVLVGLELEPIGGNLSLWPQGLRDHTPHDHRVEVTSGAFTIERHFRLVAITLEDGRRLLVGRDMTEERSFARTLGQASAGAAGLAAVLALGAGLAVGRRLLARVEALNATVLRILGGARHERVPVAAVRDEFDDLAAHFNRLLDENERLLARTREVTDDIAHDLRTPLARMRTHVESALAAARDADVGRDALYRVLDETNQLLETFTGLLRIAQIEGGSLREQMERVDLAAAVEDAVELYQPVAEEAGIAFETDLTPGLALHAERHLLAQALTNLLDNAIKYGGAGGAVRVATRRTGERVELEVADRGPGIAPEARERVLERFVRLDASRNLPGTGLGLSFVAAVAALHDAELRLESADPGLRVVLAFPALSWPGGRAASGSACA